MLIGYSMPSVTAIALGGGAGTAWMTTDGGAACHDGKPARRARFRWRDDGAPAIAHTVSITLTWAIATQVRVVAVLGLKNVPAGVKVEIYGKRPADAGTTYDFTGGNAGTVVQLVDGSFAAWFVLPAAVEPVQKVEFRFYNDLAGATWATAATLVDAGELVAMPAVDIPHESDWNDEPVDPTDSATLTNSAQPTSVRRQAYRRINATLTAGSAAEVRGAALANGMDWERVRAALLGDQRCCCIPRWATTAGAVDVAALHRTALYGTGRIGAIEHLGGDHYGATTGFQEAPAAS